MTRESKVATICPNVHNGLFKKMTDSYTNKKTDFTTNCICLHICRFCGHVIVLI